MKSLFAVALIIGVASGASMYDAMKSLVTGHAPDDGMGHYGEDYGDKKCYPTYETRYKEQCEDYFEKICYTNQKERCHDVMGKKCKAIRTSKQERKCFDVPELVCSLKEDIQYEEVPAVFTVQKCHRVTERVCDTIYDTALTEKDDFKCIEVVNPHCATKDFTVYDMTCRTVTHFDCKAQGYGNTADSYGKGTQDSYGQGTQDSYGQGPHDSYAEGSYDPNTKGSQDSYGAPQRSSYENEYTCKRTPETKCYTTPRTVSTEYCEDRREKVCEKLTERVPYPSEKQNCHDEHKKVCELEQRSQPKQVKKYVYTKHCRPVQKTVCDNADQKFLQPSCVPSSRKECTYQPEEKCENVPKQHCFKVPYQVKKMECSKGYGSDESYGTTDGFEKDHSQSYDESYGTTSSEEQDHSQSYDGVSGTTDSYAMDHQMDPMAY